MRHVDRLLVALVVASFVVSLASLAAARWWLLELSTHFRPQHIVIQCALAVSLGLRGRWRWAVPLIPVIVLNSIPVAPYWPSPSEPPVAETLNLMSVNLDVANTDPGPLLAQVEAEAPDVLLLLEFNERWERATQELRALYPYRISHSRSDVFGVALFSKVEFLERRTVALRSATAIDARLALSGRSIRIMGVHLRPPTSAEWAAERNRQLTELAAVAAEETGPMLIVGDFNVSPYSPVFVSAFSGSGLRDSGRGRGLSFSWPTFFPILGIPIDLCMVSEQVVVVEHRRGGLIGSDHYPLIATVGLR